jgi:hypothetical protein
MEAQSWLAPTVAQCRFAQSEQGLAVKTAAEQQQPGRIFSLEQDKGLRQFATRGDPVASPPRQQSQMQPRHREAGIQVYRDPIMLGGASAIAGILAA